MGFDDENDELEEDVDCSQTKPGVKNIIVDEERRDEEGRDEEGRGEEG